MVAWNSTAHRKVSPIFPPRRAPSSGSARCTRRSLRGITALGLSFHLFVACLLLSGCRGRAEYRQGEELLEAGDLRAAYGAFHRAWKLRPREDYESKLDEVGLLIAERLVSEGATAEDALDFDAALEKYTLALQYHPRDAMARVAFARTFRQRVVWEQASPWLDRALQRGDREAARQLAARALPSTRHAVWQRCRQLVEVSALAACPLAVRRALLEAAPRETEPWVRQLEERTFAFPMSTDENALRAIRDEWSFFELEVEDWILWEHHIAEFDGVALSEFPEPPGGAGFLLAWQDLAPLAFSRVRGEWSSALRTGAFRTQLDRLLERARRGGRIVHRALDGIERLREAERLESAGELLAAHDLYREALTYHPHLVLALESAERVLGAWQARTWDRVQVWMARGDWQEALGGLRELERRTPGYRDVGERLRVVKAEVARESYREGQDLEARDLPGNALLAYLEASRAAPDDELPRQALARVERLLRDRLWPTPELSFAAQSAEDARLRDRLWRVSPQFVDRLKKSLVDSFHLAREDFESDAKQQVSVEDMDFSLYEKTSTRETERGRFLRGFELVRNPALDALAEDLAGARAEWLRVKTTFETAAPWERAQRQDELELARGLLEQARTRHESSSRQVPELAWEMRAFPVENVALVAELAVRFRADRLGLQDAWVSSRWEVVDRVVDDDSLHDLDHDPLEVPSREEVLQLLAADLGRRLYRRLEDATDEHVGRYYRAALERIETGSVELAIENLATFIYAWVGRRQAGHSSTAGVSAAHAQPSLQIEDALRRLEQLTDHHAVREWVSER